MGVGLVTDVPDQPVFRRVEDIVESDGELYDPEARSKMPATDRDCINGLGTQLIGKLGKLRGFELSHIMRRFDGI